MIIWRMIMNPKIKELAKNDLVNSEYTESGCQECHYYQFDPDELQKFAESIIQECVEVVNNHFESKEPGYPGDKIEQHFGIKR